MNRKVDERKPLHNGTGLFQTLCGLKVRELYEAIAETEVAAASA